MNHNNSWYVITGAPSSGKTTVVKTLEKRGFDVIYEAARIYIDEGLAKGKTIEEIRANEFLFQEKILKFKIECEKKLSKEKIIFFDRGIPDSDAYYRTYGAGENNFLRKAMSDCSYKKAFLLEMVDYEKDYARIESDEQRTQIQNLLKESYEKINVPILVVPKMSPEQRVEYILNNL